MDSYIFSLAKSQHNSRTTEKLLASSKHSITKSYNQSHTTNNTNICQIIPTSTTQNISLKLYQPKAFAGSTANAQGNLPKLNQVIVFKTFDGIKQKEFIIYINKIKSNKNIISASKISNNRFFIFLISEFIANISLI